MKKIFLVLIAAAILTMANPALAYILPGDDSRARYFYIFGPQGSADLGALKPEQVVYILVPQDSRETVGICVYDPDTGGRLDMNPETGHSWDTDTVFSIYGKNDALLAEEQFGESRNYDRRYYDFPRFSKEEGEKIGAYYRFKLVAKAIGGKDENVFSLKISPEKSIAYVNDFTFRLLEEQNQKMYFYLEVPAGTKSILVENYDIDIDGGSSELFDPELNRRYKLNDSLSGQWAQTSVEINASRAKLLQYILTKKTQRRANAGIQVKISDGRGNLLPIYFRQVPVPVIGANTPSLSSELPDLPGQPAPDICDNKYIFDATKSYDPAKRDISYFWDFGDGKTSDKPVVTHVYDKVGKYTVNLKVRNDSNLECDSSVATQQIVVNSAPQVAVAYPDNACSHDEVIFDASQTTDNTQDSLSYIWDFGDGTTAQGPRVSKVYSNAGRYRVNLKVDDNSGTTCSVASKEMIVSVINPPLADAGKSIDACVSNKQQYKVDFRAGRPKNADTDSLLYRWDFGDGANGEGRSVSHVYNKGGTYNVRLEVDNGLNLPCSISSAVATVSLSRQPVALAGQDQLVDVGKEVSFDGSASFCEESCNLAYSWDFGDGSPTESGARVTHVYKKSGRHEVTLSVDDNKGKDCSIATDTLIVQVNTPPEVIIAKAGPGCVGQDINFDASGSKDLDGNQLEYAWDFGDGAKAQGQQVKHAYSRGGEYPVTLTVDDQAGASGSKVTRSFNIRVNAPPVANAGPNQVCCVNILTTFNGSGSTDPDENSLSYSWDFGDGTQAQGQEVTHKYAKAGKYTVTLTVNDNSQTPCDTDTDSFEAVVSANPVAVIRIR